MMARQADARPGYTFEARGLGLRCFECGATIRDLARRRRDGRYEHVNVNDCRQED